MHSTDKRYTAMVTTKQHLTLTLRTLRKDSNNTPLITTSWAAILGRLVFPHFIRYFSYTKLMIVIVTLITHYHSYIKTFLNISKFTVTVGLNHF